MHKRFLLALTLGVIGAGLLVAAAAAGSAAPSKSGSSEVRRGGTLRINLSNTDFEFLDPSLSYDAPGWQVLYSTKLLEPGQTVTFQFRAPTTGGQSPYVCTFPAHWRTMNGVLNVVMPAGRGGRGGAGRGGF